MPFTSLPVQCRRQQGIALLTVMIILLLASLLFLGTTRTNWLNESLVSTESDYQRAYAAAEALIADAETDVRGVLLGGIPCNPSIDFFGCRDRYGTNQPFIPQRISEGDLDDLEAVLPAPPALPCRRGICLVKSNADMPANWWNDLVDINNRNQANSMIAGARGTAAAMAATYGEHTGADPTALTSATTSGGSLLGDRGGGQYNAWYWIEVIPFANVGAMNTGIPANLPVPSTDQPFLYRITAVANGIRPGTRVVLRSIFVPALANPA